MCGFRPGVGWCLAFVVFSTLLPLVSSHPRRAVTSTHGESKELERLRGLERILALEGQAVGALQQYQQRRRSQLAYFHHIYRYDHTKQEFAQIYNRSDMSGDCTSDAEKITREDPAAFCPFVYDDCQSIGAINYLEIPYCWLPLHTGAAVLLLLLILILLLVWLTTTAEFICPNMIMITRLLGVSDHIAGVTLVGIGNGSADVFSMTAVALSGPKGLTVAVSGALLSFPTSQGLSLDSGLRFANSVH